MSLKVILDILNQISNTPKSTEKLKIIENNSSNKLFKKVVFYTFDYKKRFNTTEVVLQNNKSNNIDDIFNYLDFLSSKSGCLDSEALKLSELSSIDSETIDVVNRIINKDLKCGASIKTFLKVFPNLPFFELMTCTNEIPKFLKQMKQSEINFWSPKKDGVRTFITKVDNTIKYISRSGIEFLNFNQYTKNILRLYSLFYKKFKIIPTGFDGETIISGGNFIDIMETIRTKEENTDIKYSFCIFDVCINNVPLIDRYKMLSVIFNENKFDNFELLPHFILKNNITEEEIIKLSNIVVSHGDEGIVLKIGNSNYKFKEKSKYWCKVKPTETYDLAVIGKYPGKPGTKYQNSLGGLIVQYKDKQVHIGSGYTDDERNKFNQNLPRIIEVSCKAITRDGSMREPIFIRVRNDKNTLSDE